MDSETGLDPPGIRIRAVPGLVAADHFAPYYFAWAVLIENLAKIGYEGKNLHMASYDWRLSFHNTEVCSYDHINHINLENNDNDDYTIQTILNSPWFVATCSNPMSYKPHPVSTGSNHHTKIVCNYRLLSRLVD